MPIHTFFKIKKQLQKNSKPDSPDSDKELRRSGCIFMPAAEPKQLAYSASFPQAGTAKRTSRIAGSEKQLLPVSSNL